MDSTTATFKDLEVKDICAGYYMAPSIYLRDGIKVDGAGESATLQITGGANPTFTHTFTGCFQCAVSQLLELIKAPFMTRYSSRIGCSMAWAHTIMRNKFAGTCFRCGCPVPKGAGHPHRDYERKLWMIVCIPCVKQYREQVQRLREEEKKDAS
jgi:hypothetical protein